MGLVERVSPVAALAGGRVPQGPGQGEAGSCERLGRNLPSLGQGDGAFGVGEGIARPALREGDLGEADQGAGEVRVVLTERLLEDGEGALVVLLRPRPSLPVARSTSARPLSVLPTMGWSFPRTLRRISRARR